MYLSARYWDAAAAAEGHAGQAWPVHAADDRSEHARDIVAPAGPVGYQRAGHDDAEADPRPQISPAIALMTAMCRRDGGIGAAGSST